MLLNFNINNNRTHFLTWFDVMKSLWLTIEKIRKSSLKNENVVMFANFNCYVELLSKPLICNQTNVIDHCLARL